MAQTLFPGGEEGASAKRCFLWPPPFLPRLFPGAKWPHVPWLALVPPCWLQPDQDSPGSCPVVYPSFTHSCLPDGEGESGPWPFLRDQAPKAPSSSAWTSTVALGLVFGCGLHPPPTATRGCLWTPESSHVLPCSLLSQSSQSCHRSHRPCVTHTAPPATPPTSYSPPGLLCPSHTTSSPGPALSQGLGLGCALHLVCPSRDTPSPTTPPSSSLPRPTSITRMQD